MLSGRRLMMFVIGPLTISNLSKQAFRFLWAYRLLRKTTKVEVRWSISFERSNIIRSVLGNFDNAFGPFSIPEWVFSFNPQSSKPQPNRLLSLSNRCVVLLSSLIKRIPTVYMPEKEVNCCRPLYHRLSQGVEIDNRMYGRVGTSCRTSRRGRK